MNNFCKYSQYVKSGLDQYLLCSKSGTYCKYQRLCKTKKSVVHTDGYKECSILLAEEGNNMAKKKQSTEKKKVVLEEIENNNSAETVEEKPIQKEKTVVILATANFYIVNKNGSNYKIVEKNNYKKGDIVEI